MSHKLQVNFEIIIIIRDLNISMIVNGQFHDLDLSTHLIYDYSDNSYVYLYKIL